MHKNTKESKNDKTELIKADIPIKKLIFADGLLKAVAKFNLAGAAIGIVETLLDYL